MNEIQPTLLPLDPTAARAFATSLSSGSVLGSHAAWPGATLTSAMSSAASDRMTMAPPAGRVRRPRHTLVSGGQSTAY